MKKLRLICALTNSGRLTVVNAMLDADADTTTVAWKRMILRAREIYDNVIVVTTNIDANKIIDMFMEEGQILSSDVELFKEAL